MPDIYVVCEGCGQRLRNWRRYPFAPLAQWMGLSNSRTARAIHVSGSLEQEYLCHGITRRVVDRIADEHLFHPTEVWPEIALHDFEDLSMECAADNCSERFIPNHNRQQLYCSKTCRNRTQGQRRRKRPGARQKAAARKQAWLATRAEEHRDYQRRYQRRWMRLYRARKRAEREEDAA